MASSVIPTPPPPASSKVSLETAGKAVDSLLKWNKSKSDEGKPQLLEEDEFVYLILTLKKIPPKGRTNPYKIPLPHSLHPFDSTEERCLIIDDRSKSSPLTSEAAKKKIKAENIPISKVLKLSKLKSDYRAFEAKRKLCGSYDFFFADKRVIPLLPKLLGKQFFKKKKIPVPVDLTHKNWKEQIEHCCGSALLYLRTGTCSVIKVARVSMERDEIVENVIATIDGVAEIVPRKWLNVRSLHVKLSESLALPVYESVPDVGLKIEGVKNVVEDSGDGEVVVEEGKVEENEKSSGKKKVSKKGRIHEVRYMDSDLGEALDELSEEENENDELDSAEMTGKKRKKEKVLDGLDGGKKVKKPAKVKKGDAAAKQKDGEVVDDEMGGDASVSSDLKKKKKTSKIDKSQSGEMKMKTKKSKRTKAAE